MKFRDRIAGMMAGRNGNDRLNLFLNVTALVFVIVSAITRGVFGRAAWSLGLLIFAVSIFRSLSRNIAGRSMENQRYLQLTGKVRSQIGARRSRFAQRKDYCFFKCPSCKTWLRVPRGKGRITVTCRNCGERFVRKT